MVKSRWVAALAGAFLLGSLVASPAAAHDALVASDPPDGAVLEVAPSEIVLEYTGNILDINPALQVTDQDGGEHAVGDAQIDGMFVTWELVDELPAGTFDVVWVVTSSDGHPIDGEFSFTVEGAPEPEPEPEATEEPVAADEDATDPGTESETAEPEAPAPETADADEAAAEDAPADEATAEDADDPADISDNAWAWLVAGGVVTLLVLVLVVILVRRNRDPNGPPGQH